MMNLAGWVVQFRLLGLPLYFPVCWFTVVAVVSWASLLMRSFSFHALVYSGVPFHPVFATLGRPTFRSSRVAGGCLSGPFWGFS